LTSVNCTKKDEHDDNFEEDEMHTPPRVIEMMKSLTDRGEGSSMEQIRAAFLDLKPQERNGSTISANSALPNLAAIARSLERIADAVDPPPPDKVDTAYVAKRLGIGLARVSQMAGQGEIPPSCIVAGTGNGKLWKFHRARIDEWIDNGRT
jgi:hypothetical protein